MSTVMRARHLSKWYGKHEAVRDVSLDIEPGALTAVIGPNGAGKTTTISMLTGLAKPDGGVIEYAQTHSAPASAVTSVAASSPEAQPRRTPPGRAEPEPQSSPRARFQSHMQAPRLGVVFQGSVLDPMLTVRENLSIRARLYPGIPRGRVSEVIALIGAESFAGQRYGSLSGGQRRSIDIARALINRPELLVLDEPTTGLDITTRRALWTMLDGLRTRENLSILLTTHYLEEANYAQQVYLIDHGAIRAQGSAQELIARYTQYTLDATFSPEHQCDIEQIVQNYTARAQRFDGFDGAPAIPTTAIEPNEAAGSAREATPATDATATIDSDHLRLSVSGANECIGLLTAMRPYILDFRCLRGTMNDVFLTLTGHGGDGENIPSDISPEAANTSGTHNIAALTTRTATSNLTPDATSKEPCS
ncbi:ABC transporter ATP-binding protein [Bifidobacterium sp.]|jgi:multidrug/hemolysin transport system ATP-binding protein|uniref:ABC transporter ATP-binding protein n=1 Tax=Bifidobacterium sp. TaxID=41200 RepID=UPI0025C5BC2C|nr:ABC transporter ATP-binding protein [Bifidobacterium sp.]MCH4209727.1 ABC transporter ATP-binding protein [Bifidobacterium sp.]MCI1224503.1 ABC transporter ATP-binding protein [Bifidobacterium sp.]